MEHILKTHLKQLIFFVSGQLWRPDGPNRCDIICGCVQPARVDRWGEALMDAANSRIAETQGKERESTRSSQRYRRVLARRVFPKARRS